MAEPAPIRPPRLAIVLDALGRSLIFTGIVVLLFVVFQLWGTDIQEARAQTGLRDDLNARLHEAAQTLDVLDTDESQVEADDTTPESTTTTTLAAGSRGDDEPTDLPPPTSTLPGGYDPDILALFFPEDGDALARIEIPAIDIDKLVVQRAAVADLRTGPGHYNAPSLPGGSGNAAIAGHRTTYGKPFNRIDELVPGDEIVVTTVQGEFRYEVLLPREAYVDDLDLLEGVGDGHIIVDPGATWVLEDFGDNRLTLTACHPKLSSRQRIIVAAQLVDDAVELPDWIIEANLALEAEGADTGLEIAGEDVTSGDDGTEASDDQAIDDPSDGSEATLPTATADLDEGLNGERDAIPGAAAWMFGTIFFWYAGGWTGRRWMRRRRGLICLRLVGLVPAVICLWFSFEMIDRALPAG